MFIAAVLASVIVLLGCHPGVLDLFEFDIAYLVAGNSQWIHLLVLKPSANLCMFQAEQKLIQAGLWQVHPLFQTLPQIESQPRKSAWHLHIFFLLMQENTIHSARN